MSVRAIILWSLTLHSQYVRLQVQAMYGLQKAVHEFTCRSSVSSRRPATQYVQEPIDDTVTELERLPVGDAEEEGITQILQATSHPLTVARVVCLLALRTHQSLDQRVSIHVSGIANDIVRIGFSLSTIMFPQ